MDNDVRTDLTRQLERIRRDRKKAQYSGTAAHGDEVHRLRRAERRLERRIAQLED